MPFGTSNMHFEHKATVFGTRRCANEDLIKILCEEHRSTEDPRRKRRQNEDEDGGGGVGRWW